MEVTHESHVDEIREALSATGNPTGVMLQIGTRNTQNFELLKLVGKQQEFPVLIKRGFGITLDDSLNAAEYLATEGNRKVVFCLRGMKTNLGDPHRNFVDFSHVPVVKRLTRMPVVHRSLAFGGLRGRARPTDCSISSTPPRKASSRAPTWCSSISIPSPRRRWSTVRRRCCCPNCAISWTMSHSRAKRTKSARSLRASTGAGTEHDRRARRNAPPRTAAHETPAGRRRRGARPDALPRAALARRRTCADDLALSAAPTRSSVTSRARRDARRRFLGLRLARRRPHRTQRRWSRCSTDSKAARSRTTRARCWQRSREFDWRGVVAHFRGCGGEPNRLPRAYHSGDYAEVGAILAAIRARIPQTSQLHAVGVSLGGSALLNWLGRAGSGASQTLTAAAAVSAPLDLMAAGLSINQGLNRMYAMHFLSELKPKSLGMAKRFPGLLDPAKIRRARTLWDFDDVVTAPLHGFSGTHDYWTRASSKPWLRTIALPTLVINARNDPFIPADSLPSPRDVGAAVVLEQPREGGHAGFARGPYPGQPRLAAGTIATLLPC